MYSERIEQLIKAALVDGVLTEKEKQILFRRAQEEGIELDEFEMVLDARLIEAQKENKKEEKVREVTPSPKSDKYGELRKCPACGEIVNSGIAVCESCGYAFTESHSIASREKLYDTLIKIEEKFETTGFGGAPDIFKMKKKATLKGSTIANFPIPNTKADLLDFLTYLVVLAKPHSPKSYYHIIGQDIEDLGYAYWQLYSSCINKARISFAKDPNFTDFYNRYEELLEESKKFRLSRTGKFIVIYLAVMAALFLLLAIMSAVR